MDKKRLSPLSKWTREKARAEARKQDARYAKMFDSFTTGSLVLPTWMNDQWRFDYGPRFDPFIFEVD